MYKLGLICLLVWLVIFFARLISIGGFDPDYRENAVSLLKPSRTYLEQTTNKILPYPQSGLLSGILLGSNKKLPFALNQQLKTTSTIHIVVASGQNLALLAGFLVSPMIFLGRKKTLVLIYLCLLIYGLITGLGIPIIRATIMLMMAYLGQLLGRPAYSWWIIGLTAGAMVIYQPNWLMSVSFQLSFLATCAVVLVSPVVQQNISFLPGILKEDLSSTLSAQALTMPIIALNFNQLSLIGILANLAVLWTVPVIMVTGFLALLGGLLSQDLGMLLAIVPDLFLTYFIYMVRFFASLPFASTSVPNTNVYFWLGYYLVILSLIMVLKLKAKDTFMV